MPWFIIRQPDTGLSKTAAPEDMLELYGPFKTDMDACFFFGADVDEKGKQMFGLIGRLFWNRRKINIDGDVYILCQNISDEQETEDGVPSWDNTGNDFTVSADDAYADMEQYIDQIEGH